MSMFVIQHIVRKWLKKAQNNMILGGKFDWNVTFELTLHPPGYIVPPLVTYLRHCASAPIYLLFLTFLDSLEKGNTKNISFC